MKRMRWVLVLCALAQGAVSAAGFRDVPESYWAKDAIAKVAARGVMPAKPAGKFQPEQAVTRAELAGILVRLIDYLENRGPQKLSASPATPVVPRRQRAALARLPRRHPAYPALARLVQGGYLVPNVYGDAFLPTPQNLDRPVTREEVSLALAGISIRVTEKRVAVEHPESLKEGHHRGPNEERPTIRRGQQPHRHGNERPGQH